MSVTATPTRRNRRRALLLAPVVAFALVAAACGGDSGSSGGGGEGAGGGEAALGAPCPTEALASATGTTEVRVWHAYVGLTKTTLEELAAKFNASQSAVKVVVEAQGTYEELLKKFEDSLADPQSLPDMILPEDTTTQFMIDSGVVIPAANCIEKDTAAASTYDDVLPAVTAAYTVDEVLWPGAFSVSTPVLYANDSILSQAGVSTTEYPQTLNELRAAAEKIKAANIPGLEAPLVMKIDSWYLEHWLTGAGKEIVNESNGRAGLATTSKLVQPTTTEIMDWLEGMVADGLIKAIPSSAVGVPEYEAMNNRSAAMLIQTSTAITTVAALLGGTVSADQLADAGVTAPVDRGLDIGVGLVPGLEGAGQGQIGGSAWYLLSTGRDAAASGAWEFIKFFLQVPNQVDWTLKASYLPVLASAADDPTLQADFTSTTKGQWLSIAYQGLQNLDPDFPGPVIGPYKEFRVDLRNALDNVILNQADATKEIEAADEKFQTALDGYAAEVGG